MSIKRGFNAKQSADVNKLKGILLLRAFADEGTDTPTPAEEPTQVNFETLIANARKEEKEKLYPRIKKLEDENKALIQTNNDNLIKLATAQKELEDLKTNSAESKKVKDLETQLSEAQAELQKVKESTPSEEAVRAKIEAEYEVKYYRTTKLSENADKILAVFADEVQGTTKEEIDSSFDRAVEKTLQTKKQLGLVDENGNPIENKKSAKKDSTKESTKQSAVPPVANPSTVEEGKFDFDYVQNLDPRSQGYLEFRKKMGLK